MWPRIAEISYKEANDIVHYDRKTGQLHWRALASRKGAVAHKNASGYMIVTLKGRPYPVQRIAWLLMHGKMPAHEIDHINANRTDNRASNLRAATRSQNERYKHRA